MTRIADARHLKAVGWPLDTSVVDREHATMHYKALIKAYGAFGNAWMACDFGPHGPTAAKWKLFKRRLVDLDRITAKPAAHRYRGAASMIGSRRHNRYNDAAFLNSFDTGTGQSKFSKAAIHWRSRPAMCPNIIDED